MKTFLHSIVLDIKKYGWMILCILPLFFLRVFDIENCIFHILFGINCPGCGLSRAYICFFQGEFAEAFSYHPLFLLIPLMIILFFCRHIKKISFLYKNNLIWWIIIVIWVLFYLIRIIV